MFYSHEILTSRQYGVATIWLVATIGNRTNAKKVTRKAIQEVDVEKACGKILEPGAPIALRLQGNLLFGVSKVYNQQCAYMLTDAKKIQNHINMFFGRFSGNQLDPDAGFARPENLVIMNDPDFVPDMQLPKLDYDEIMAAQASQKTSSQMSPLRSSQLSGSGSSGKGFPIQLDLGRSDSSGPRGSPFGLEGLSPAQKAGNEQLLFTQEDDFPDVGDWGLEIDEFGDIIETADPAIVQDEPELPPLPRIGGEDYALESGEQNSENNKVDEQGDLIMAQEEPMPEAEPFPEHQDHAAFQNDERPVPARRRRRARALQADEETQLSRNLMRDWQDEYRENCVTGRRRSITATQAKRNAMLLTFGLGLGNIGKNIGIPGMVHPLALVYSGDSLFTTITGLEIPQTRRGRRRSASEAIEDDMEQENRRVRPRLEDKNVQQQGRNLGRDDPFAGQIPSEVGREAEPPMSEGHHSSAMPWNRGSSAMPGSSIRGGPGSAQKGRVLSSPHHNRGDFQDIIRFSDDMPIGGFGSDQDGFDLGAGLGSHNSSFDGLLAPMPEGVITGDGGKKPNTQEQNEYLRLMLDREGQNFLSFIEEMVRGDNGERRQDDDFAMNRKWVGFDDLFVPSETTRTTAAQAFYHTLCLTTKGKMYVEQEGADYKPFGSIWIGAKVTPAAV
ncbi:Rec8 like protein-domain-containing protein [Biscogniauxia marginata]|nr:Rec8 like protein-domain-containing protein [Biscogniauxia marginata]